MKSGYSLLLDTHVVIWMATQPERLPASLLRAIETVDTRFVSHVSAWEIQIKHEKYGSKFNFSLPQLEKTMKAFSCTELPIEYGDIREDITILLPARPSHRPRNNLIHSAPRLQY